ncbi:MAG TPA: exosortase V [Caulobacteraceae bacterium]
MDVAANWRPMGLRLQRGWWLLIALGVMAIPTVEILYRQEWTLDFGAYGPIVLATGAWLLGRQAGDLSAHAKPGPDWLTFPLLLAGMALYLVGRTLDFPTLDTAGIYVVGLAILCRKVGPAAMRRAWFPLLYLALVIPVPQSLLAEATAPLKTFVSYVSTGVLSHLGVPVVRQGVTIFVAQYQLLVEDACSGMNSIVGLIAVGLLYVYLMRGASAAYSAVLVALVVPIAILTNILRIMTLILLTYYGGDAVAQGFLHFTAGMVLFAAALGLVFLLDTLLHRFFRTAA